tara:strand:- start:2727 stop:3740 length:1014 start_codon:yes stop_codon:yes gene_type:complete
MVKKSVTFVLDKRLEELNKDIEEISFTLKNPLAGERIHTIKKFTKALIDAHAKKIEHRIKRSPPKEAIIISTKPEEPIDMDLDFPFPEIVQPEIPRELFPPRPKPQMRKINIRPRMEKPKLSRETLEKTKKPLIKGKKQPGGIIKIPEEKIELITSQITKEEMASATKKGMFYFVNEAELSENEIKVLNGMKQKLDKKQDIFHKKKKFVNIMKKTAKKNKINPEELSPSKMRYFLIKHVVNYGLIDPLLHDSEINKIVCEGPKLKIKILRFNEELITNLDYGTSKQLNDFINSIAKKTNKKITEDNPILDADFEGFRIHATLGTEGLASKYTIERTI